MQSKIRKNISELLSGQPHLRSKRALIEQFIEDNLPKVNGFEEISDEFDNYWNEQRIKAFRKMCEENDLNPRKVQEIIDNYLFTERKPIGDEIVESLNTPPQILQRRSLIKKTMDLIVNFIDTFIEGV
jgi:type I restriction enzyme R subunit